MTITLTSAETAKFDAGVNAFFAVRLSLDAAYAYTDTRVVTCDGRLVKQYRVGFGRPFAG